MSAVLVQTSSSTTRCGTVPRVLNLKISTSSLASSLASSLVAAAAAVAATSMAKMEMEAEAETNQNGTEQRVKRLPSFISHPNENVLRVFNRKRSNKQFKLSVTKPSDIDSLKDLAGKQCSAKQRLTLTELSIERQVHTSALLVTKKSSGIVPLKDLVGKSEKIRLPSFISHPNGFVLRVFKRQRSRISSSSSEPTFICQPNGIVLQVLNQKQSRIQSLSCVVVKCSAKQHLPLIELLVERQVDTSALSVTKKLETEMHQNCDEQRVKQLKRAKQRVD